ncbi:hypothetical protein EVAR_59260_1 [Eumeta japonica]|uniref:Uncharacterized protein n=1 Tax=Eumeta variegata TaxID=151549 RepID=A0A4C1YPM9_EUMVA|nr:hypothetical protein EVAR_59260_1 [Eumeta japonica]
MRSITREWAEPVQIATDNRDRLYRPSRLDQGFSLLFYESSKLASECFHRSLLSSGRHRFIIKTTSRSSSGLRLRPLLSDPRLLPVAAEPEVHRAFLDYVTCTGASVAAALRRY